MSIRESFFNAMRRKDGSFIPFEFNLCPSLHEEFKKRTGIEDYSEYYKFPARILFVRCTSNPEKFFKYYGNLEGITIRNDWGVGDKPGSVAHFTQMQHPMMNFETLEELESYPYPDPVKDFDWAELRDQVSNVKSRDLIAVGAMETTIFEIAWYMRGMDNFLMDMAMNPEFADYHLDRITGIRCEMARQYASSGCDVLRLGDDVSTQLGMMMHPDMWRGYFKERLSKVIQAAKDVNPDIMIFYHGDGNLSKIIPDLIDIGVEILNPIQPECVDPIEVKKMYGDRLSFWGTIGTQTTMPFGTSDEVRDVCRKMIEEVGKGGGLLLAPTHVLEPEVLWDNIEAFVSTVQEFNDRNRG